jgi:hypothetical protein
MPLGAGRGRAGGKSNVHCIIGGIVGRSRGCDFGAVKNLRRPAGAKKE